MAEGGGSGPACGRGCGRADAVVEGQAEAAVLERAEDGRATELDHDGDGGGHQEVLGEVVDGPERNLEVGMAVAVDVDGMLRHPVLQPAAATQGTRTRHGAV
eukprot:5035259-Prymnesium_polylepis.1